MSDAGQGGNLCQRTKTTTTVWKLLWALVGAVTFIVVMYYFGLI